MRTQILREGLDSRWRQPKVCQLPPGTTSAYLLTSSPTLASEVQRVTALIYEPRVRRNLLLHILTLVRVSFCSNGITCWIELWALNYLQHTLSRVAQQARAKSRDQLDTGHDQSDNTPVDKSRE